MSLSLSLRSYSRFYLLVLIIVLLQKIVTRESVFVFLKIPKVEVVLVLGIRTTHTSSSSFRSNVLDIYQNRTIYAVWSVYSTVVSRDYFISLLTIDRTIRSPATLFLDKNARFKTGLLDFLLFLHENPTRL